MTYEERYEAVFLARSWEVVRRIVASALVLLGVETAADATCIPENTLLSLRRLLRPAEAMLRRILVVEALKLGPIMSRSRVSRSHRASSPGQTRSAPGFTLIEPWPSTTPYDQRRPICRRAPHIHSFTDTDLLNETPDIPASPDRPAGQGDLNRLQQIEAILAAPDKAIKRLALWFGRRKPTQRSSPLKIGRPPPTSQLDIRPRLADAQHFANAVMDRFYHPT